MDHSDQLVLFDFDGTVATGPGPVLAYARLVASTLRGTDATQLVEAVERSAAGGQTVDGVLPLDGYDLVRLLATRAGTSDAELSACYLRSRALLGTTRAPVSAPDGLAELLVGLRERSTVLLVTNAPDIRLRETLSDLGLDGLFDAVLTSARKPAGMPILLDRFGVRPAGTARALSVGDVWVNDLEPVHARGHSTALVAVTVPPGATPTFQAADLPSLTPLIADWPLPGPSARLRPLSPLTTEGTR